MTSTNPTAAPLRKVVTRTDYSRAVPLIRSTRGTRTTRYLADDGIDAYIRDLRRDAYAFQVSGTVHVDGRPFAAFGPLGLKPAEAARELKTTASADGVTDVRTSANALVGWVYLDDRGQYIARYIGAYGQYDLSAEFGDYESAVKYVRTEHARVPNA